MNDQNEDFSELDKYYQTLNYICPKCNSKDNVIPCAFGRPSQKLIAYAEAGKVKLMGCCISPDKVVKAFCKSCQNEIYD